MHLAAPAAPAAERAVYIVRLAPGGWPGFRQAVAASGHVAAVEELAGLNMALVTADPTGAVALAGASGVLAVRADAPRRLERPAPAAGIASPRRAPAPVLGWNLRAVGAGRAWDELGVTGEGVVIAVLDSGADWLHPALRKGYRGRLGDHDYNWFDATGTADPAGPVDPFGHGTAVLGVALGRAGDVTYGVAPGAEWIAARAFDRDGRATDSALLRAAAWLLAPTDRSGRHPRPELAPNIVVCSWALDNGADPLFETVLDAWRAAGILPVCAAGNDDLSGRGRVLAPASDPDAVAVGASVPGGAPWPRSRPGPGFGMSVKPDLLAPGVGIAAPAPGGGDTTADGTSYAAPHVAGAAALALSANPDLTVADLVAFLHHGAQDVAPPGPDPVSGWGNLDAMAVAATALTAGRLTGRLAGPGGGPVSGTLRARPVRGGPEWTGHTAGAGTYSLALPAGIWSVTATAFAATTHGQLVHVRDDQATRLDLMLAPMPTGDLVGHVTTRADLAAAGRTVAVAGGPAVAVNGAGDYRLSLPAGRHVVRFQAAAHRTVTTTVAITAGQATVADASLAPAPRVLVVDADAVQGERVHPYLLRGLADAGVTAQVWAGAVVAPGPAALPAALDLAAYDLVFWLHGGGSPGLLDAATTTRPVARALEAYLGRGGRLVLSGQDVGLRDAAEGPADQRRGPDLYRRVLGARWLADGPPASWVQGRGPLDGLALDLRWPGGAGVGQSWAPDVVAPAVAAEGAVPILVYPDGTAAALGVMDATLGQRAYLAFGLQQAGGRVALATLLNRLLDWLAPPELAVVAGTGQLAPGASTVVTVTLRAAAGVDRVDLGLRLPPGLAAARLPAGMLDTGAGELRWTGRLAAGARRDLPVPVTLAGPAAGLRPLRVLATTVSWRRPITAAVSIRPVTPDLGPSTFAVRPERLAASGAVTAVLALVNGGPAAAPAARAAFALPEAFTVDVERASASAGSLTWAAAGPAWLGDLRPREPVTVTLPGRLPAATGAYPMRVRLEDGAGVVTERSAPVLVGGPDLAPSSFALPDGPLAPGDRVTATLRASNAGDQAARLDARLHLPPGVTYVGGAVPVSDSVRLGWPEPLAPGSTRTLGLPLALDRLVPDGPALVRLTLDDGEKPARSLHLAAQLTVQRSDLAPSRLVLYPERPRSGDLVTGTLLVANAGTAPAQVQADVALAPTLSLDTDGARSSTGTVSGGLGWVGWSVDAPAAAGQYTWRVEPVAALDELRGQPVDPGRVFRLGLPFPLHTTVYTQAVATADGLLRFGTIATDPLSPAAGLGTGDLPPAEAVAPLWRPRAAGAPLPRVRRASDTVTVTWPGDAAGAGFAVTLAADGGLSFDYGAGTDGRGAVVGLGAGPDGAGAQRVANDAVAGGRAIALRPPLAWRWLRFAVRPAQGVGPNSTAGVGARLRGPWGERTLSAAVRANPVDLDATTAWAEPGVATPGGRIQWRAALVASGTGEARAVTATIDLPDGATLDPDSVSPGLDHDRAAGRLTWRGRVAVGSPRVLAWAVRLPPSLPPGGRVHTLVDVVAAGVPRLRRHVLVPVQATDFTGSAKLASRSVAAAGEVVTFTLRAAQAGPGRRRVSVTDALPDRLALIPASLSASVGDPPVWDAASRSLRWSGLLDEREVAEVTLAARFGGGGPVRNIVRVEDDQGTAAAFWVVVAEMAHRVWLPALGAGR